MTSWILKTFDALSPRELYAVLQLRNEVFVVEQNCVFQDADDKDQDCQHFMGWQHNKLVAYTRIVPPGLAYKEPSIGRVITAPLFRKQKLGKELMQLSIEKLYALHGIQDIKIGAQLYLKNFYESFGFYQSSPVYLEDGIEHIEMIKKASL